MWHAIWHLDPSVAEKIVRAVLVYAFLILAIRLVGERELGQMNTLDLVALSKGAVDRKELFKASISLPELRSIARRQGFSDLDEVKTAILETDGAVSMFDKDVSV